VRRGLAREDLFTVVLEHFQTDTADWADIVLPATTQLEHWDVHLAYGHFYATLNRPAIAPLGECLPNSEIFRRLAARMGLDDPMFADDDLALIRQALWEPKADARPSTMRDVTFERLLEHGWTRLGRAAAVRAVRRGRISHAERASASSGRSDWRTRGTTRSPRTRHRTSCRRRRRSWRGSTRSCSSRRRGTSS
jgi:anaerobic selenocysteine-containing dehydrogenase